MKSALGILIGGALVFVFFKASQQDSEFVDGQTVGLLAFGGALLAYGFLRPILYQHCFISIDDNTIRARWKLKQEWKGQRTTLAWYIKGLLNPQYKQIMFQSDEVLRIEIGVASLEVRHYSPRGDVLSTDVPLAGLSYKERQGLKQAVTYFAQQIESQAESSKCLHLTAR